MKKMIFSILFGSLLIQSFGQVEYTAIMGLNYSNLSKIDVPFGSVEERFILSCHFGSGVEFPLNKNFSFNGELLFNMKGGERVSTPRSEPSVFNKIRYNYLSLPVYSEIKFGKLSLMLGGEPSVYLFGFFKYRGNKYRRIRHFSSLKPDHTLDLSLIAGIGYSVSDKLTLKIRYAHGFRHTFKYTMYIIDGKHVGGDKEFNRVVQVSFGYNLN